MSFSADYNLRRGIPAQIENLSQQLALLRKYAAMKPEFRVALQEQVFGLANGLKYSQDLLAPLKATDIVARTRHLDPVDHALRRGAKPERSGKSAVAHTDGR